MKLDLRAFNAIEISFDVSLALSKKIVDKLHSCFPKKKHKKDDILFFGEDYVLHKKKLYERGLVFKVDKTADKYVIIISYSINQPLWDITYDKKDFQPLSVLLDCLSEIEKKITLNVAAGFLYADSKYATAQLTLPIRLENNEYFDEIRGVRFTKTQDNKIVYSVIMDRPENKDISTNIIFQYTGTFSKNLPENITKYATDISRKVINER